MHRLQNQSPVGISLQTKKKRVSSGTTFYYLNPIPLPDARLQSLSPVTISLQNADTDRNARHSRQTQTQTEGGSV
jgi:hypothetical protein